MAVYNAPNERRAMRCSSLPLKIILENRVIHNNLRRRFY